MIKREIRGGTTWANNLASDLVKALSYYCVRIIWRNCVRNVVQEEMSFKEKGKGQWPKTVHNTSLSAFGELYLRLYLAFKLQDVVF